MELLYESRPWILRLIDKIRSVRENNKTCLMPVFYLKRESLTFLYSQYSWLNYLIRWPLFFIFLETLIIAVDLSYFGHFIFVDRNMTNVVLSMYNLSATAVLSSVFFAIDIRSVILSIIGLSICHILLFFLSYCSGNYYSQQRKMMEQIINKVSSVDLFMCLTLLFLLIILAILSIVKLIPLVKRKTIKVEIEVKRVRKEVISIIIPAVVVSLNEIIGYLLNSPILAEISGSIAKRLFSEISPQLFTKFSYLFTGFLLDMTVISLVHPILMFLLYLIFYEIFLNSSKLELENPLIWIIEVPSNKKYEILYKIANKIELGHIINNFSIKIIDIHKIVKEIIGNKYKFIKVFIVNYTQDDYAVYKVKKDEDKGLAVYLSLDAIKRVLDDYSSPEVLEEVIYEELLDQIKRPVNAKSLIALSIIEVFSYTLFSLCVIIPLLAKYFRALAAVGFVAISIAMLFVIETFARKQSKRLGTRKRKFSQILFLILYLAALLIFPAIIFLAGGLFLISEWSLYIIFLWAIALIPLMVFSAAIMVKTGKIIKETKLRLAEKMFRKILTKQ